ncbi:MAG TPA: prepilin-type N-terminal cleavage/methylation domain-containing protein [Gemmatimonas sp.]|nr:prepilin-type N-terminal cleavage/methylation domain-containing protein [Gemmatimonas sp.]
MPAILSTPPIFVRRGVTLLELLVVLVLMAVASAVVLPLLDVRPNRSESGLLATDLSAVDALVAKARRAAIQRGAPVRLRVAADGLWAMANQLDGELLSSGRLPDAAHQPVDLHIDAMGSCLPAGTLNVGVNAGVPKNAQAQALPGNPDSHLGSFDALTCRFDVGSTQ